MKLTPRFFKTLAIAIIVSLLVSVLLRVSGLLPWTTLPQGVVASFFGASSTIFVLFLFQEQREKAREICIAVRVLGRHNGNPCPECNPVTRSKRTV